MIFKVLGISSIDFAVNREAIKNIMAKMNTIQFFSAIDLNENRGLYCISDQELGTIKLQLGNKNKLIFFVPLSSGLGYQKQYFNKPSIYEATGQAFQSVNFIGWFRSGTIHFNPKCPGLSDQLLLNIWKELAK
jgi:hypothetical protein